tara:strand:- start:107 stop:283 length:177 start_codon:yes stop_codon:yes gene_type:complete
MSQTIKKINNLNKLKSGCLTCLKEATLMKNKISNRNISKIEEKEFKKIVSSLFKNKLK